MTGGADLLAVMAASWPAEQVSRIGPWSLRHAPGAGSRVNCATAEGDVAAADPAMLAVAARAAGQVPTVMLRPGDAALDALLAARGWRMGDEVVLYEADLAGFGPPPPPLASFCLWPPLGVQRLLWAEDGTGPAKQRVMDRAPMPKTALLGRAGDRAAGAAFSTIVSGVAFVHALVVAPALRRQGVARTIMGLAGAWVREQGGSRIALAVTRQNHAARRLYASMGMRVVGQYHYRVA